MADDQLRGRFVWHELLTTDTDSAADFYRRVVGWTTQAWPHDAAYTLFMAGGRPVAGLMILPEDAKSMGAPPSWLTYIGTSDVDDTARRAAGLGGRVLRPAEDIPAAGRFAIVQDPQGATFGLYTPAQAPAGTGQSAPSVGDFSWHELATDDWAAAWSFYQALFGWEKTSSMDMGPEMGTYQMFGSSGQSVGGMFKRPPAVPAHWMPYAMIKDAKAAARVVVQLGGRIVHGPAEVPGGDLIAQGIDLQGAAFAVHSSKPAARVAEAEAATATPKRAKSAGASRKRAPKTKTAPARRAKAPRVAPRKPRKTATGRTKTTRKPARASARATPIRATARKKPGTTRKKKAKQAGSAVRRGAATGRGSKRARRAVKKR